MAHPLISDTVATAKAIVARYTEHGLKDVAAGVSFWTFLSLFPTALAFVALVGSASGIIGGDAAAKAQSRLIEVLADNTSGALGDQLQSMVNDLFDTQRTGLALVSVLIALWSSSKGFSSLCRALALVNGDPEARRGMRGRAVGLMLGFGTIVALTVIVLQGVLGPLFGFEHSLPSSARWLFSVLVFARLPVLGAVVVLWVTILLKVGPGRPGPLRAALPGALVTTVMWLLTTVGFSLAVRLGVLRANPLVGALGGVLLFLTWLHLMSTAILVGGELNAYRAELSAMRRAEA